MSAHAPKRPSSVDVAVGRNVRIWRMNRGFSQAQLARRLGVTFQQVQKYETGSNRIGTSRLVMIAAILDIPIPALLEEAQGADPAGSLLALIDDRRSFRLAQAFAAIADRDARLSIVNLVEKVAATVPQTNRRPN
jgi:transcriptional regulator with XRE-family HTH domain